MCDVPGSGTWDEKNCGGNFSVVGNEVLPCFVSSLEVLHMGLVSFRLQTWETSIADGLGVARSAQVGNLRIAGVNPSPTYPLRCDSMPGTHKRRLDICRGII